MRRTEFITALYENIAVPLMIAPLLGTPFPWMVLRLFGMKIARNTLLLTTYMTEFDLVEIGEKCAINSGVSLQTHLFEDRIMKMSHVRIGPGSTIGQRSVVLYDSEMKAGSQLGNFSLLMKGEILAEGSRWERSQAKPMQKLNPLSQVKPTLIKKKEILADTDKWEGSSAKPMPRLISMSQVKPTLSRMKSEILVHRFQSMFIKSWFLICLLINEFPIKRGTYFGIDVLVEASKWEGSSKTMPRLIPISKVKPTLPLIKGEILTEGNNQVTGLVSTANVETDVDVTG